jgi:hypothetical protein
MTGLQQGRSAKVLSRRRGRKHVPVVRDRLLCEAGPHLRFMQTSTSVKLYHGMW